MSNAKKRNMTDEDSIFFEIESELPDDTSDLMFDGKRIESHGGSRSWLDDDGR